VPSRIARRLIAPALPEFLNDHPEIQVDLGSSDRIIDLVEEGIDCALRVGELVSNSLVARPRLVRAPQLRQSRLPGPPGYTAYTSRSGRTL